jgi:hypothetical protein
MAKVEVEQEAEVESQSSPSAELVIGLPGVVDVAQVRNLAEQWSGAERPIAVVHP